MRADSELLASAMRGETGPTRMAALLEDSIVDLSAQLETASTRAERSRLNKLLHRNRQMLAWCKTRAGYRADPVSVIGDGSDGKGGSARGTA
jgi:hypothetical protein